MTKPEFFLPDEALDADTALLAKKGSGKTYTAKLIVERLIRKGRRVLIFDPVSVWWGLKVSADGKRPGLPVAVFGGPHGDMPLTESMGRPLARILARENLPSVIDFGDMPKAAWQRLVADMLEELFLHNREALTIVLEEADVFAPQAPREGDSARVLGEVDRIARRGRAFGFRLVTITQRPARLQKDVLTQLSTLIALRLSAPHDLAAVKDWVDANAERGEAKAVIDDLPKLKPGEGWVYSPDFDILKRETFPKIETLDTSATPKAGEARIVPKVFAEVDLSELRAALEADTEAKPAKAAQGERAPSAAEIEAARQEGFAAGKTEGIRVGRVQGFADARRAVALAFNDAHAAIIEPLEIDLPPARPKMAAGEWKARRAARLEECAQRVEIVDVSNNGIVAAARAIWPLRLTYAALMATAGRKARGGYFGKEKREALAAGLIREEGGLVTLIDPPAQARGADALAMIVEKLPGGAGALFEAIAEAPGMPIENYADVLGKAARGGAWGASVRMLRQNDLIEDCGGGVVISRRLKARAEA